MDNKNITLTIDEIHEIRYQNYEVIKNMTDEEIINKTKKSAERVRARIEELKKNKDVNA